MARLLAALICLVTIPRVLAGQADTARAESAAFGLKLRIPYPPLALQEPEVLRAPWLAAPRLSAELRGQAWDSTIVAVLDSTRTERAAGLRNLVLYGQPLEAESPTDPRAPPPGGGTGARHL